ncbi:hypothetical protein Tco_0153374 [Tanacetum coccineum]
MVDTHDLLRSNEYTDNAGGSGERQDGFKENVETPSVWDERRPSIRIFVLKDSPWGARATGVAPRIKLIWNSTWRMGGRPCRSLGNTYGNSLTTGISSSMTNYRYWLLIASSGWPFVFAVLGQMAHLVASITLNSARSCVMQGAFLTQGTVSNIPIIFSWSGSISPEGFLSSVLLWLVIIITVVGVGVMVIVVIIESYSVIKLSFVIT